MRVRLHRAEDAICMIRNIVIAINGDDVVEMVRKLLVEIWELKRTRAEAEATARAEGYRAGAKSIVNRVRAQGINIHVNME